jgi:hypothetical protein
VQYLAVWRVAAKISAASEGAWERLCRATAPGPAYLYIPAFTLARAVVQRIGVSLTEAQPALELAAGLTEDIVRRPTLVEVTEGVDAGTSDADPLRPEFGTFSPVVVGRTDSHVLAHFVYLSLETSESRALCSVDYELDALGEDLVFIPAVWDPRCAHHSNWRLLLREFDGLVA